MNDGSLNELNEGGTPRDSMLNKANSLVFLKRNRNVPKRSPTIQLSNLESVSPNVADARSYRRCRMRSSTAAARKSRCHIGLYGLL